MPTAEDHVDRYFAAMGAHDWPGVRAALTDDFTREGPYEEHVFPDPETYVAFLAGLLPGIQGHSVEITRLERMAGGAFVELTEGMTVDATLHHVRVCCVFDLVADGRISHIEVYVRRPPAPTL